MNHRKKPKLHSIFLMSLQFLCGSKSLNIHRIFAYQNYDNWTFVNYFLVNFHDDDVATCYPRNIPIDWSCKIRYKIYLTRLEFVYRLYFVIFSNMRVAFRVWASYSRNDPTIFFLILFNSKMRSCLWREQNIAPIGQAWLIAICGQPMMALYL